MVSTVQNSVLSDDLLKRCMERVRWYPKTRQLAKRESSS